MIGEATLGPLSYIELARAQPIRNLIARLRGQKMPAGITKSNGRLEATQVDVSSKYPGRLAEVNVEEGLVRHAGTGHRQSPFAGIEAQLRAAQSDVQRAKDALVAAEAEIGTRQSALEFAKGDFERGPELIKTGTITKQTYDQRRRNFDAAAASVKSLTRSAIRPNPQSRTRKLRSNGSSR